MFRFACQKDHSSHCMETELGWKGKETDQRQRTETITQMRDDGKQKCSAVKLRNGNEEQK